MDWKKNFLDSLSLHVDILTRISPLQNTPDLPPEGEGGELPVDPDVCQQQQGGGQQELHAEHRDAVVESAIKMIHG